MATAAELEGLIPAEALQAQLPAGASITSPDVVLAREAAYAYVTRYHDLPGEAGWPYDYRLGAVKLTASLYRDKASPGVVEPFSSGNVYKRATDIEIEQLLRIGRFALPGVG